jgi:drug/metabolite transporter (DMT)-like permease
MSARQGAPSARYADRVILRAYVLVFLTVLIWGGNVVLLKVLLTSLPVGAINSGRFLVAGAVLVALAVTRSGWPRWDARTWGAVVLVGLIGNSVFQTFFLAGIERSPAGISSLLNGVVPVLVALVSPLLGLRVTRRQGVGIAVSLAGLLALVMISRTPGTPVSLPGLALLLMGAVTWAAYTVANRPLTARVGTLPFVAFSLAAGSLPYVALHLPELLASSATPLVWSGVVTSALLANVFAYLAWANGVSVLGAARTSVWNNLAPVVGITLGALVLHERFPAPLWLAVGVVLVGVLLTNWPDAEATAGN